MYAPTVKVLAESRPALRMSRVDSAKGTRDAHLVITSSQQGYFGSGFTSARQLDETKQPCVCLSI